MVDQSEKKDRCQTLHSALKLYTNVKRENEPLELSSSYLKTVNTQLKTIKNKLDPSYMSDSDYLDDSKLLQYACVDHIIESADINLSNQDLNTQKLIKIGEQKVAQSQREFDQVKEQQQELVFGSKTVLDNDLEED